MITPHFDQEAIDRYISSQVADKLATSPSKAEGLELPFTDQDVFLRDFLVRHYPAGSMYSEFPMWINHFCDNAIEMSHSETLPRSKYNVYLAVETSISEAEYLMNRTLDKARVAATLAAVEIDRQTYFKKRLIEIGATFQNHTAYLRSRFELERKHYPAKNNEKLVTQIEDAVQRFLSDALTEIRSTSFDMKNLISAHA